MLSKRLELIYSLLEPGLPVWDLGCDHGYIGLRAVAEDVFPEVHFVDCSTDVIDRLNSTLSQPRIKALISRSGTSLDVSLSRGQDLPWNCIRGNIVIAGMGGSTMIEIISAIPKDVRSFLRLILSPEKGVDILRRALADMGWMMAEQGEYLVKEGERFREVFVVQARGTAISPYGQELWKTADHAEDYLNHLIRVLTVSEKKRRERPEDLEFLLELKKMNFESAGEVG
jgi:tRNA (adenine22-N1)-methyltransferase